MPKPIAIRAACVLGLISLPPLMAAPVSLFDGKSLDGWEIRKGEEKWWKVVDGMIAGGSLTEQVPYNTFIASAKGYENFDLSYKLRLVKGEGFMNSGMQIRSKRKDGDSEMIGYQVDAGIGYWGDLYDESRRNVALAKSTGTTAKDWEWNEFRVLCEGPRIRTWINGVAAIDYTEKERDIAESGVLGLQTHGGGKLLVQLKDISITELPSSNGARTPEQERAGFTLPAGYSAELVASEEQGVGKPITVSWDRHGRMWTMTAMEYPVDEGTAIGPNLSGAGAMGTESLLRNILTPNARLESGYYRHDVKLTQGSVASGFLVGESADSITLRGIGAQDQVIPRAGIASHDISRRSLMPEGLIDGFNAQQVSDLFSYLRTLQ